MGNQMNFVKQYHGKHQVIYQGTLSASGTYWQVDGQWQIPGNCNGTF